MADTVCNLIASYLTSLAATNPMCVSFGTTFSLGSSLLLYYEQDLKIDTVTVIPIPSSAPNKDGQRLSSSVQIRVKSTSRKTAVNTSQEFINRLNRNSLSGKGIMYPRESIPITLGILEGGEKNIVVTHYTVRHIKA